MIAIGVGGADVVDVMAGLPWYQTGTHNLALLKFAQQGVEGTESDWRSLDWRIEWLDSTQGCCFKSKTYGLGFCILQK